MHPKFKTAAQLVPRLDASGSYAAQTSAIQTTTGDVHCFTETAVPEELT